MLLLGAAITWTNDIILSEIIDDWFFWFELIKPWKIILIVPITRTGFSENGLSVDAQVVSDGLKTLCAQCSAFMWWSAICNVTVFFPCPTRGSPEVPQMCNTPGVLHNFTQLVRQRLTIPAAQFPFRNGLSRRYYFYPIQYCTT